MFQSIFAMNKMKKEQLQNEDQSCHLLSDLGTRIKLKIAFGMCYDVEKMFVHNNHENEGKSN